MAYIIPMRALVDIPKQQLDALAEIGRRKGVSRAEVIRTAVDQYLGGTRKEAIEAAFGLWKDHPVDALEHQRRLREEW
jgi:metal-responsive CopG/Arc/MetJ family transcriptional regulator